MFPVAFRFYLVVSKMKIGCTIFVTLSVSLGIVFSQTGTGTGGTTAGGLTYTCVLPGTCPGDNSNIIDPRIVSPVCKNYYYDKYNIPLYTCGVQTQYQYSVTLFHYVL